MEVRSNNFLIVFFSMCCLLQTLASHKITEEGRGSSSFCPPYPLAQEQSIVLTWNTRGVFVGYLLFLISVQVITGLLCNETYQPMAISALLNLNPFVPNAPSGRLLLCKTNVERMYKMFFKKLKEL